MNEWRQRNNFLMLHVSSDKTASITLSQTGLYHQTEQPPWPCLRQNILHYHVSDRTGPSGRAASITLSQTGLNHQEEQPSLSCLGQDCIIRQNSLHHPVSDRTGSESLSYFSVTLSLVTGLPYSISVLCKGGSKGYCLVSISLLCTCQTLLYPRELEELKTP